jgi:hypothetical protein
LPSNRPAAPTTVDEAAAEGVLREGFVTPLYIFVVAVLHATHMRAGMMAR